MSRNEPHRRATSSTPSIWPIRACSICRSRCWTRDRAPPGAGVALARAYWATGRPRVGPGRL